MSNTQPATNIQRPAHWSCPQGRDMDAVLTNIAEIGAAMPDDTTNCNKQTLRDAYRAIRKDIRNYRNKYEFIIGMWELLAYPPKSIKAQAGTELAPFMPKWK